MKTSMRTLGLLTIPAALLLGTSLAIAGSGDKHREHHGGGPEKHFERLAEELDLTAEQSEQLKAVMEAAAEEREALREKFAAQIKPELCSLHLATVEQVREILSPEQAAELEERMERWGGPQGHGGHHSRAAALEDCEASS